MVEDRFRHLDSVELKAGSWVRGRRFMLQVKVGFRLVLLEETFRLNCKGEWSCRLVLLKGESHVRLQLK